MARVAIVLQFNEVFQALPLGTDPELARKLSSVKIKISKQYVGLNAECSLRKIHDLETTMDDGFITSARFGEALAEIDHNKDLTDVCILISLRLVNIVTEAWRMSEADTETDTFSLMEMAIINFAKIEAYVKRSKRKLTISSADFKTFVDRGRKLYNAGVIYNTETSSNQKFASFNRALIEWSGLKVKEDDDDNLRQLAFAIVAACNPLKTHYNNIIKEIMDKARAKLYEKTMRVQKVAGGGVNNTHWHTSITPAMSIEDVLSIANGPAPSLLNVPDEDAQVLKTGKATLEKATGTRTKSNLYTYFPSLFPPTHLSPRPCNAIYMCIYIYMYTYVYPHPSRPSSTTIPHPCHPASFLFTKQTHNHV